MPEDVKSKNSRPVVSMAKSPRGYSYLEVRWAVELKCKYEPLQGEMYKKSGISAGVYGYDLREIQL